MRALFVPPRLWSRKPWEYACAQRLQQLHQPHVQPYGTDADPDVDADVTREELLDAALEQVPRLGWTAAALRAAAQQQGLSPAVLGLLPRGEAQLAEHFVAKCNTRLKVELAAMTPQLAEMRVPQRVQTAVRRRLEMLAPHVDSWPAALALLASPASAPHSLRLLYELVDDIWYAAGDTSTDASWYSKRGFLAGVYVSTELYMLTDFSPGYEDTWGALERRLGDVQALGRTAAGLGAGAQALVSALAESLGSAFPRGVSGPRPPPAGWAPVQQAQAPGAPEDKGDEAQAQAQAQAAGSVAAASVGEELGQAPSNDGGSPAEDPAK